MVFFAALILVWEVFGRARGGLLMAPFSETAAALFDMIRSGEIFGALWISNQAMLGGFLLAAALGVPLGLLKGRVPLLDRALNVHINLLLATPVSALIPLVIAVSGIGLRARALVVLLFAFPAIVVNTRTGVRTIGQSIVEMAQTLGARPRHLWRRVYLPGAAPAILTGLLLGLARAINGMVVVELLLIAVGLGKLILGYMSVYKPAYSFAVILVIMLEAVLLMDFSRRVEARALAWRERPGR
jgi:NitT/TauT family transport system permease protein